MNFHWILPTPSSTATPVNDDDNTLSIQQVFPRTATSSVPYRRWYRGCWNWDHPTVEHHIRGRTTVKKRLTWKGSVNVNAPINHSVLVIEVGTLPTLIAVEEQERGESGPERGEDEKDMDGMDGHEIQLLEIKTGGTEIHRNRLIWIKVIRRINRKSEWLLLLLFPLSW